ncbi:MAG: hypothetical protein K8I27_16775 [Planctomycetes bacterium]|nr:hypothetical protein [Planctomycetota bacterium]
MKYLRPPTGAGLRVALQLLLASGVVFAVGESADAYMSIRVPLGSAGQGLPVRWDLNNTAARPNIANRRVLYEIGDLGTRDAGGFTGPVNEFEAVQNSFAVWRDVNESEIDFEFNGATTNAVSNATDNRNVIRWVDSNIASGVFAVTITTFDTTTGQIVDADMELNDRDFTWDTLGPAGTTGSIGRAMVENVVTHELGHFLGFDHPANSQSTLFFASSPGLIDQTTLEIDDRAQLLSDYTSPTVTDPTLGTVQGSVSDVSNPRFGVGVTLIDVSTGRNVIGHVTEGTPGPFMLGSFSIENVPPGNYLALALPIEKSALGSYYGSAFTAFYPTLHGLTVGAVGAPTYVKVAPGATVTGVNLTVPGGTQNPQEPDGNSGSATPIASGQSTVSTVSPATDEDWLSFTTTQPNQQVNIRVLSDAFGFSLNPTLTLYGTDGSTVLVSPDFGHPNFVSSANDIDANAFDVSGVNYDAEIERVMAAAGTYFFKVASKVGATSGHYVVLFEVSGVDTAADTHASVIASSVPGIAAGGAGTFTVTVTPRNIHGRDLNAPNTYMVELMDVTGAPTVLQTIPSGSTPFQFTVNALGTSQVKRYGARIDGQLIAAGVDVSHFGTLSLINSRIALLEATLNANGYDRIPVMVELRDGSGNPLPNSAIAVTLSTTAGTLDNGTTTGAGNVPAVFGADRGVWLIDLVAPTNTGTATITAFANAQQIDSKQVSILARAAGTGGGPAGDGGGGGNDDDGGGCVAGMGGTGFAFLALLMGVAWRRRPGASGK